MGTYVGNTPLAPEVRAGLAAVMKADAFRQVANLEAFYLEQRDRLPLHIGDQVTLRGNLSIPKHSGWYGSRYMLVPGNRGRIDGIDWYDGRFVAQVSWDVDFTVGEMWSTRCDGPHVYSGAPHSHIYALRIDALRKWKKRDHLPTMPPACTVHPKAGER